jgi:hemolysin D
MVVVPEGVELEVEARLANRDVGFVREGQEAVVKLEAFPFTRFGTIHGTVARVSTDAVGDERQGLTYAMRVALGAQHVDAGGRPVALAPGMAAAVEVRTGERRLISFFLEPLLRYREESLRER